MGWTGTAATTGRCYDAPRGPGAPAQLGRERPAEFSRVSLPAFTYSFANLVVTSARDLIDNSLPIRPHAGRYAGIPT